MDSGPATNTRTLDVTLRDTVARLDRCRQTPAVKRLRAEAQRYLDVLAAWRTAPPPPRQQDAVIDEVLALLKEALAVPQEADSRPVDDAPEIVVGSEPPPTPRSSRPARPIGKVPVRRQSTAATDGPERPAAPLVESGPRPALLRSHRLPWRSVAGLLGVSVRPLEDEGSTGPCRAMVRLEPGASLPRHRHGVAEDLWVLAGSLEGPGLVANPGDVVRSGPGTVSGPLTSPGECLVLLTGSDRHGLLGSGGRRS